MNEQKMKELLEATLKEALPDVVDAKVEAKTVERFKEIEESLSNINKSLTIWFDSEEKANKKVVMKAMWNLFRGFKSVASGAIHMNDLAEKAFEWVSQKADYLNETTDAEGAYLVPVEFAREVMRVSREYGVVRKNSRIIPMWTDTKDISTLVNSIVVYWTDEGAWTDESKPTVWQVKLIAEKCTAIVSSTEELIDDQMTDQEIRTIMTELIGEKFAEFEDTNVLAVSTKFTPLLTDTNVNVVELPDTKYSFEDLTYDDLVNVVRAIPTKYKKGKNVSWFMNQDILAIIDKLKDTNGDPLLRYSRTMESGLLENMLLGYPVHETDVMPNITDDADNTPFILFGDLKYWAFGDRRQLTFASWYLSGNWEKWIQSLKATERIAWKVIFADAFAVLKTDEDET